MLRAQRYLPAVLAAIALTATSACASGGYNRYPTSSRQVDDRAYRFGFDEGREQGANDARRGRNFDYSRHDEYRDAGRGNNRYGDSNEYRRAYQQGFAAGYDDGYRRYARAGRDGYRYPGQGSRPSVFGGGVPRSGGYASPAADNGYRDGYEQGRKDGRDRNRFDPVRASRYRSGDHDYNDRYGSRDQYKREYRAAFEQGYEQGYRGNQR